MSFNLSHFRGSSIHVKGGKENEGEGKERERMLLLNIGRLILFVFALVQSLPATDTVIHTYNPNTLRAVEDTSIFFSEFHDILTFVVKFKGSLYRRYGYETSV